MEQTKKCTLTQPFFSAEGIKTVEQRERFGGIAQAAFDTCYHQAVKHMHAHTHTHILQYAQKKTKENENNMNPQCDTTSNIAEEALTKTTAAGDHIE